MKKVYLRATKAPEIAGLRIVRQSGPVIEGETELFPRRLRQALDKAGRKDVDILVYGKHVIDMPGVRTPHPAVFEDPEVRRALAALDPDLMKWLLRFR